MESESPEPGCADRNEQRLDRHGAHREVGEPLLDKLSSRQGPLGMEALIDHEQKVPITFADLWAGPEILSQRFDFGQQNAKRPRCPGWERFRWSKTRWDVAARRSGPLKGTSSRGAVEPAFELGEGDKDAAAPAYDAELAEYVFVEVVAADAENARRLVRAERETRAELRGGGAAVAPRAWLLGPLDRDGLELELLRVDLAPHSEVL